MPYGLSRMERFATRRKDAQATRIQNVPIKQAERARREKRLFSLLRKGTWPYTSTVRNWLSNTLDMPAHRITEEDVKQLLASNK